MSNMTPKLAKNAVQSFLTSQYDKKTEKEQKQLAKAIEDNDIEVIAQLKEKLSEVKAKYELEVWMDNAVNKMAKQIGFGTHISKGIHSSSKGDNINFQPESPLPAGIVGHQSVNTHQLDASGNAAALPLYSFFEHEVNEGKTIKDFIIDDDKNFEQALSNDKELSQSYFKALQNALIGTDEQPATSEYNKQTLWFLDGDNYICLIPLYPSSLTNYVFNKIQHIKYSEDISTKRKNRQLKNPDIKQQSYPTISNLAVVHLGGSNPQGVSRHMSSQRGVNYLLPSLPPMIGQTNATGVKSFTLSKRASTLFNNSLEHEVKPFINQLFNALHSYKKTVDIREARDKAIARILNTIFIIAETIRNDNPAGWSKDSNLDEAQKFWLDPKRAELEGEEDWQNRRESEDWHKQIIHDIARWINDSLQTEFKDSKKTFGDTEHLVWEKQIEDMKNQYERAGKGVFL